jgi:flagellar hook protein FlgE
MALTSAMLTGFTGIRSNQAAIDTIGNNVANVNTTAFKSERSLFETLFVQTIQDGTAPSANQGGTNPLEIGYGSGLATTQRSFEQGTLDRTGRRADLAIDGGGFFIVNAPNGEQLYTRDGSFDLNTDNVLVNGDGAFVQGFAADASGTIIPGVLSNLTIPLGTASAASATTQAVLNGNLNAAADVATAGSISTSQALTVSGGGAATDTTPLTNLVDAAGAPLFASGDIISLSGAQKGGITLPDAQFIVGTDGNTLGDFATFLQNRLGINSDPSAGGTPGVTVTGGSLVVTSNLGDVNAIDLSGTAIRNSTSGALPFSFTTTPAVGGGVTTGFIVFDSLGNPVDVRIRAVLESQGTTGSVWRFFAESPDDSDPSPVLGTGTITFDQNGQFVSATGTDLNIDRAGSGAVSPMPLALDFSPLTGLVSSDSTSTLVMSEQNGRPPGTLIDYAVDDRGLVTGTFSNGVTQAYGQVALATFANPEGLLGRAGNYYTVGPNSGAAQVVAPQSLSAGRIQSGALELSNVELTREFVGLITASTGFSAASRVVKTADDLLQELLLLAR